MIGGLQGLQQSGRMEKVEARQSLDKSTSRDFAPASTEDGSFEKRLSALSSKSSRPAERAEQKREAPLNRARPKDSSTSSENVNRQSRSDQKDRIRQRSNTEKLSQKFSRDDDNDEIEDRAFEKESRVVSYDAAREQLLSALLDLQSNLEDLDNEGVSIETPKQIASLNLQKIQPEPNRGIGKEATIASNKIFEEIVPKLESQQSKTSVTFEQQIMKTTVQQNLVDDFVVDMRRATGVQPDELSKIVSETAEKLSDSKKSQTGLSDKLVEKVVDQFIDRLSEAVDLSKDDKAAASKLYQSLLKDLGATQDGRLLQAMSPRSSELLSGFQIQSMIQGAIDPRQLQTWQRSDEGKTDNDSLEGVDIKGLSLNEASRAKGIEANGALPVDEIRMDSLPKVHGKSLAQSYGKASNINTEVSKEVAKAKVTQVSPQSFKASSLDSSFVPKESLETETTDVISTQDTSSVVVGENTQKAAGANALNSGSKTEQARPQGQEQEVSINQLMDQARVIARKGGGEMKVQMQPEGLGKVNMKVDVNNGKVNVEIMAENSDTKKLIESKIGDLKSHLETHKLNLDNVRVELADKSSNAADMMQQQFNRQQAHDFLSNFRDSTQSFRQAMMDPMSIRRSRDPNEGKSAQASPEDLKRTRTSSRRLDLVA